MRASIIPVREDAMKFSEFSRGFLRYKIARGMSPRTGEVYELSFKQFLAHLASQRLDDDIRNFTGDNVDTFITALLEGGCKGSSVLTKLAGLSSLGMYGMRVKDQKGKPVLAANPVQAVERPAKPAPQERYLYAGELRQILASEMAPNERLAIRLLLYTQLRASAAVNAKVKDLSMDGDQVKLSVVEKGDNPDTFVLPDDLATGLLDSLKLREARPDDRLLVNAAGQPYTRTSLSEMIAKVARNAGVTRLPVRAHLLGRHSPASIAGQSGASVFEIAAMLRHRDANTAKRYVHGVTADAVRDKFRAMVEVQ